MYFKFMKKIISILLSVVMLTNVVLPAYAFDIPTPPPAPTAPALPNNSESIPTPPPVPTAPPVPTLAPELQTPQPTPKPSKTPFRK
jgi:outer membrane biosynthesis protein TonB